MGLLLDPETYVRLIAELPLGKRLPEAVYLHADAIPLLGAELRAVVERARSFLPDGAAWNVAKFSSERLRVSLLWYPRFFEDAFPALQTSYAVDLASDSAACREYPEERAPILHRKERMLPPGHPLIGPASAVTRQAEALGLFESSRDIGHRAAWEARLARLGLRVVGMDLVPVHDGDAIQVDRHRTALTRYSLSTPVQALWRHGFLDRGVSVFDYGCGRGDDLRALQGLGLNACGWDPYFAPDGERRTADVVNLGFVLNVIEDQPERLQALRGAWSLTKRVLAVAVLIKGRTAFERARLYRDGVLTGRGTFQKYFSTDEFRGYLEESLDREPIAVAPGIAFVFRTDEDEQAFLARRARARTTFAARVSLPRPERPPRPERVPRAREPRAPRERMPTKWEVHAELADDYWATCLSLGRLPEPSEYARLAEIRETLGHPGTVFRALIRRHGEEAFQQAAKGRHDDLLVFLALNLFERRRSFNGLPDVVQRDIRAHFGSYQNAQVKAQELLFSTGKPQVILDAARSAASAGLGFLDGEHSLQLHSSLARELPPVLRVYLGCAARLYGDVETADLIKLHVRSGKVSIMSYDDFEGKPLPKLIERVKINLRRQQIDFFEHSTSPENEQLLYMKSRFIRPGFPLYEDQVQFDRDLATLNQFSFEEFGPSSQEFEQELAKASISVDGFSLRR